MSCDWTDDDLFGCYNFVPVPGPLEQKFWIFHNAHPIVYSTLVHFAHEWRNAGHVHCGIKMLYERCRWELMLYHHDEGKYKLSNNHHAFYARLIETQEPVFKGFFRFRKQKIQATFGPDNKDLPSGKHNA